MASKYDPLGAHLRTRAATEVPMSFSEIEKVIGAPLPPKAQNHAAWWSNNPSNNVMTKVWLDAGYRSERVDLASRRLVFRRSGAVATRPPAAPSTGPEREPGGLLGRLRSRFAGAVTVGKDVDLTAPLWKLPDELS